VTKPEALARAASPKRLLQALSGQAVKTPPIWLMRQAGRYLPEYRAIRAEADGFLDLCFRPDLAVEVTLQPIRRFGFDAAILFSDILVVPHGLGQKVWFEEGAGPKLERLQGPEDLAALRLDGLEERLGKVYETVRGVRGELNEETALIGFAGAPWTVATYMVEGRGATAFEESKRWLYGDPDSFGQLISLLVEATTRHLLAQIRAGAEAVQIFDSWAGALSDDLLRRWSLAPLAEITFARHTRRCRWCFSRAARAFSIATSPGRRAPRRWAWTPACRWTGPATSCSRRSRSRAISIRSSWSPAARP
jgi:uroporphyrinogen decarboxylase